MSANTLAPFELSSVGKPDEQQRSQEPRSPDEVQILSTTTQLSKRKATFTIICVGCSTLLPSIVNGMFTVEIPFIAVDVRLSQDLLLWPQSVVSLVSACTLLLAGSISDVVGSRHVYLAGTFLQTTFILGVSLARTGTQILVFRALMGLAQSMCWTSSVSIVVGTLPEGKLRNVGFACMGGGQPLGFSLGLVLAGVFTESLGWRFGLYLVAGINAAVLVMAAYDIRDNKTISLHIMSKGLRKSIDWIGLLIASASLAMLSYMLA
jgi:MFS family permease